MTTELKDRHGIDASPLHDGAVTTGENAELPALKDLVFARQLLPLAEPVKAKDDAEAIKALAEKIEKVMARANRQIGFWTFHVFGQDDDPATQRAIRLDKAVVEAVRKKKPKLHKRYLKPTEYSADARSRGDIVIQAYLKGTDEIWFSVATLGSGVSPFMGGVLRMRHRSGSPSRSSSKLEEALAVMGKVPTDGESAVDLGAAPGGWTFTMARYGVLVTAVDHGALDLPETPALQEKVTHLKENGLKYLPPTPVDWLCCDMVVQPEETLKVLDAWLSKRWMKHFVVNVKLPQENPWPEVRAALDLLAKHPWAHATIKQLYHDRKEVTVMGTDEPQGI